MLDQNTELKYNYSIDLIKDLKMRGSIRALVGFLVVFGAVGGLDNATDGQVFALTALACAGLAVMFSGVNAMRGN